ncbi:MAG: helix-turn-helix domain-containing protein [Candidatus Thermoplasmatota archaeon]|nr:helix-turn-helix domain-containing protein [Candidatus Thermoplasmatota archaeon]
MIDEDIEAFISAIENSTRREILRSLILDQSYAFQISRIIGVSQQAINKQLELLERANLITSAGSVPSSYGAPRKIYRPTGFSTLVADYSRNFISVRRYDINPSAYDNGQVAENLNISELLENLRSTEKQINEIMEQRTKLILQKDRIMGRINAYITEMAPDALSRAVLTEYIDSMNPEYVARKLNIPVNMVMQIVETYLR